MENDHHLSRNSAGRWTRISYFGSTILCPGNVQQQHCHPTGYSVSSYESKNKSSYCFFMYVEHRSIDNLAECCYMRSELKHNSIAPLATFVIWLSVFNVIEVAEPIWLSVDPNYFSTSYQGFWYWYALSGL